MSLVDVNTWLVLIAVVLWCVGSVMLFRVPACPAPATPPLPRCSVIVPARNEEHNLGRLLGSLKVQTHLPAEILVVDDHSEDRTAVVARQHGARVVSAPALPADWLGKPWACWQGAQAASAEVLVFVDADTWFDPEGLARLVSAWQAERGVVSLLPYHAVQRPYEELSVFFHLLQLAGTNAFTVLGRVWSPAGLFGPCVVLGLEDYRRTGGHTLVKHELLEHFALAKPLKQNGLLLRLYGGQGVLQVRMYPGGLRELIAGWSKSFAAGAGKTPGLTLGLTILWLSGMVLATLAGGLALIFPSPQGWIGLGVYIGYGLSLKLLWRHVGAFSWATALLFPVPLFFFFGVFGQALMKKQVEWKGRVIQP